MGKIAHINRKGETQTVSDHCRNTALYASSSAERRRLSSAMYLAGILHDTGKLSGEFQKYITDGKGRRGSVSHSGTGGAFLLDIADKNSKLAAELIACAIYQHHGLMDCIADGEDVINRRSANAKACQDFLTKEDADDLLKKASEEISAYVKKIQETAKAMSRDSSANKNGMFLIGCLERLILSYLVDADWRDTSEFADGEKEERASENDRQKLWVEGTDAAEAYVSGFDKKAEINQLRSRIAQECLDADIADHGIYRLSVPTGGGKTVTGLRLALKLAGKYKKRHIIYVAPFISVLEQNAEVIQNILESCGSIRHRAHGLVLEHHSDFVADDEEAYKKMCSSWDAPVIMTTMVQLLDTMFLGKMKSVRRFNQLTDAVFIIDEAQSIPVKCISMFNGMMNFLCHITGSICILCTATQPLFENTKRNMIISSSILSNEKYYREKFRRNRIRIINDPMNIDDLASFAIDHFDRSMLIVLNTKNAVKKLYEKISEKTDAETIQLTANMCAQHRLDVIAEMKRMIKDGRKIICISTQLIEAGVDISFRQVIRSLAGMDSIMQSAGRCNRNGEYSDMPTVYAVNFTEEDLTSLRDIREARNAAVLACDLAGCDDSLSDKAVRLFYRQYFFERETEMDYAEKNGSLYELLSSNVENVNDFYQRSGVRYPHYVKQSFKSAGQSFRIIENAGIPVVVRYGKSEQYIKAIEKASSCKEIKSILKKLQRFTVTCRCVKSEYIKAIEKDGKTVCYVADSEAYGKYGLQMPDS